MVSQKKQHFFHCGMHRSRDLFNFELKKIRENNFFSKMILTHESGSQEDQFDGKKKGQKSCGTVPLREYVKRFSTSGLLIKRA